MDVAGVKLNVVKTVKDVDKIIPLIDKQHSKIKVGEFISKSGYLFWIISNIPSENFQVLYGDGCYLILQAQWRALQLECNIVDAYSEHVDVNFTAEMFEYINTWAKERGCTSLSCLTTRHAPIMRKYGFKDVGTFLMKEIGG